MHVDDLTIAGKNDFLEKVLKGISESLIASKVVRYKFRFIGWDIEK